MTVHHTFSLLPEWTLQDAVLLSWPHAETDWADVLPEVEQCYRQIATVILQRQHLVLVGNSATQARSSLPKELQSRCIAYNIPTNDTWIRDYGPLCCADSWGRQALVDCGFNAWGMKFAASLDNRVVRALHASEVFAPQVIYHNALDYFLEGGAIEVDGQGSLLTTASCIEEGNRNPAMKESERYAKLRALLGAEQVLVLHHGALPGDDTDGHIDTLARFIAPSEVAYVTPSEASSVAYEGLVAMEKELKVLAETHGWKLIPLPDVGNFHGRNGDLLPATYANFLFINGALLLPIYNRPTDADALRILQEALPHLEVVPIDCSILVEQHGSLHCATMQIPHGMLNPNLLNEFPS